MGGILGSVSKIAGGLIGGPVGAAIGGVAGGLLDSSGASRQEASLQGGINDATNLQNQIYRQQRADYLPYQQAGRSGVNQLSYLLGVTPEKTAKIDPATGLPMKDAAGNVQYIDPFEGVNKEIGGYGALTKRFSMADYQADPGFQFRQQEGQKALDRANAARGNFLSGAAIKAAQEYNQGLASQEYGAAEERYNRDMTNLYNRLAGLTGTGQTATSAISGLGSDYGQNVSDLLTTAGSVRAAGSGVRTSSLNDVLAGLFSKSQYGA